MLRGLVAILRTPATVDLVGACGALYAGGITNLEITLNTPGALQAIEAVRREFGEAVQVGAGTILCEADSRSAISAGAQFVVTPTLQPDTVQVCRDSGVTVLCGAMTPTEILAAHETGADYVKLFPAGSMGIEYIRAILGPLPFVKIVPTGGVTLQNVSNFLEICPAVGVGGSLVPEHLLRDGRWDELGHLARRFVAAAHGDAA